MTPLAHAGHWLVSVAAVAPVVGIAGWLLAVTVRDRRRRKQRSEPGAS